MPDFKSYRDPTKDGSFVIYPWSNITTITNKETGVQITLYKLEKGLMAMIDNFEYIIEWGDLADAVEKLHTKHKAEV